jgi:prepilin-type processing-associated H-X9-DG protein
LCYPYKPNWCSNVPELNLPSDWGDGSTTDTCAARSRHPGGVQVLVADGSVHFVQEAIELMAWRALATIANGEPPNEFY